VTGAGSMNHPDDISSHLGANCAKFFSRFHIEESVDFSVLQK